MEPNKPADGDRTRSRASTPKRLSEASAVLESNPLAPYFAPIPLPATAAFIAGLLAWLMPVRTSLRVVIAIGVLGAIWIGCRRASRRRRATTWRLHPGELQQLEYGQVVARHAFSREQPFQLQGYELQLYKSDNARDAPVEVDRLCVAGVDDMRIQMFPFVLATRRLGMPVRVVEEPGGPLDEEWHYVFDVREAALLEAAAEGPAPAWTAKPVTWRGRPRIWQALALAVRLISAYYACSWFIGRTERLPDGAAPWSADAALFALSFILAAWAAGWLYRALLLPPARWHITPDRIRTRDRVYGSLDLPASRIAAIVPQYGGVSLPGGITWTWCTLQFYGYDLRFLGTAQAKGIRPDDLLTSLAERGYRIVDVQR
ncbi:hypothetical protein DY218_04230 [Streptomyces triticagri]|uniref:Uncharacterized protein n=1 Tax=Streptomyces triticagri TaxID=2293568 RepID=A0A372MAR7_9ACTN|nr:hypothetical protein [Streptomyces triticagri]RFU87969.1 hypothetical protein DY218_04230 [Streptomyces triticagri]